jgi:hypothetical protein
MAIIIATRFTVAAPELVQIITIACLVMQESVITVCIKDSEELYSRALCRGH